MKIDGMFFGNVMMCTRYNRISLKNVDTFIGGPKREDLVRNLDGSYDFIDHNEIITYENVVLIQIGENNYIMYNDIKESLENKIKSRLSKKQINILTTAPTNVGSLFVNKSSLKECCISTQEITEENIKVKKIQK